MEKKQPVKQKILPDLILIPIALLLNVSIYCCLIKYKAKQKHLLPYHITNNKRTLKMPLRGWGSQFDFTCDFSKNVSSRER